MRLIFYFCKACSVRIWFQTPFYPLRRACAYDLSSQTRRPRLIRGYYLYANCLGEFDVHAHLVPIMSLSWILIYKLSDLSVYLDTSLSLYAYGREMRGATKSALIIRQFLTCFSIITSWVSMICFRYGKRKRGLADEFTRILSKCSTYFTFLKIYEIGDN